MKYCPLLLLLFFSLYSCQETKDPIREDLLEYVNVQLPKIAKLEQHALDTFDTLAQNNFSDDSITFYKIRNVVIPTYTKFFEGLSGIKPKTDSIQRIHMEYVEAAKDQLEAFKLVVDAIETHNEAEVKSAIDDLDKAGILIMAWKKDMTETSKRHGLDFELK